jgi:hypothetical protein
VRSRVGILVIAALAIGAVLRLSLPTVFSYLGDEAWTFDSVQHTRDGTAPWPALGMPSSRGVKNAPMSVWVFVVLGTIGQVSTPEGLTRAVAVLAILAHVALLAIPISILKEDPDAKAWLWAIVLTATNPILVFLERKIWAQSVLPIFDVALLVAWLRRETRGGAFAWGAIGALVGQIHMAGFFFVPSVALWTRVFGKAKPVRWWWWLGGSALGALPAIPWLAYLAHDRPPPNPSGWWLRFRLEFYQYFFSDPSALCSTYVVGDDLLAAMKYPIALGHPTYLVGAAHVALAVASIAIAKRALEHAWTRRGEWKALLFGDRSETGLLLGATLLAMGPLMTLPSISIHRHYMMAIFPLPYVWTARAALRRPNGDRWLAILFAGGLVVSAGLLAFLADRGGAQEFGRSWGAQVQEAPR